MIGYVALATAGVLIPQLEMYGDMLWRGTPGARTVALTFDDGPHPETTRRVLEMLRANGGQRATFFVVGRKARQYPDVVREIHAAGHAIGLHGYEHDRLYALKPPAYTSWNAAVSCGSRLSRPAASPQLLAIAAGVFIATSS